MCTKLIAFVCILTLTLAATGYGELVVGDFETGYDGWGRMWGNHMVGFSGTGATLGGTALKIVCGQGGWGSVPGYNVDTRVNPMTHLGKDNLIQRPLVSGDEAGQMMFPMDAGGNYTGCIYDTFKVDITVVAAEWTPVPDVDQWIGMDFFIAGGGEGPSNSGLGWYGNPWWELWAGTTSLNPDGMTTLSYDFSADVDDIQNGRGGKDGTNPLTWDGSVPGTTGWNSGRTTFQHFGVYLMPNTGGYSGDATFYIDNARFVPEPTTIALLGLGGLSLLRIRRKR